MGLISHSTMSPRAQSFRIGWTPTASPSQGAVGVLVGVPGSLQGPSSCVIMAVFVQGSEGHCWSVLGCCPLAQNQLLFQIFP